MKTPRHKSKRIQYRKSGKIPLTLIEADTPANRKAGLMTMAAAMRDLSHCHADILAQYARQIGDSYTSAQAIANYTEDAGAEPAFTDGTQTEATATEIQFTETTPPLD